MVDGGGGGIGSGETEGKKPVGLGDVGDVEGEGTGAVDVVVEQSASMLGMRKAVEGGDIFCAGEELSAVLGGGEGIAAAHP